MYDEANKVYIIMYIISCIIYQTPYILIYDLWELVIIAVT